MRKEDWRACCWRYPLQPAHWPDVVREERRKPLRHLLAEYRPLSVQNAIKGKEVAGLPVLAECRHPDKGKGG